MKEYMSIQIDEDEPTCFLTWKGKGDVGSITLKLHRDFNWFQRKMLKLFFGLEYTSNS